MKTAFAIVTLSGLLSACAVAPHSASSAAAPAAPAMARSTDAPAPQAALPSVPLTSELLYKLLKAELDFQAGEWQGPYITLLGAAQETRDPRLAQRAAEMALAAKQATEAMAAITLWRELAPDSEEAAQYYLGFSIMAGEFDRVEPVLAARLAEAPAAARGGALFQVQQLLGRARDKHGAAGVMQRLAAPYQDLFEAHIVLSQSAHALGDTEEAQKEARAALAQKPDAELAVLALAQATTGDEAVAKVLSDFLAANPGAREVRAAYARVLVNHKDFREAREQFQRLLEGQPDNLGTLYALGILSLQLDEPKVAERHLTRFMEVYEAHPDDERDPSKVLMMLTQIAEDRGEYAAAQAWLDKVAADNPQAQFQARLKQAQLQGKQGKLSAAKGTLDAIDTEDRDQQAQVALTRGQILRDAGKYDAAYKALEAAARRFPGNPDVLYDFALAAEKIGKVDVMEATLREVIAQAPENHHAYNALGYSLAERNVRLDEARQLIDKALKMAPDDPFIMDSMGWVEYRLGNLRQAEEMLRRAYALRTDPEIGVHLAEVLWKAGKRDDAQKLLREARAKDPKNDTLRSTLARLNLKL
ncbi:MAG TPA: tetratricopeptide repeat protein [Telluria sp.]|nr:tetratricopeptide repeat protein [Telluria sp.]